MLEITEAVRIGFHGEDTAIGADRARGEGGVIAEVGAHIEKGHAVAAGGLEKTGLRFFVHAKMQRAAHDGIGGVEHDRGSMNFNLLG